jgi:sugar lactone lactonase YvrE
LNAEGNLSDQRVFLKFEDLSWGYPDGLTCDIEGCLWIAHWGGARISRFSREAQLLESIPLPISQPTSCTFGGADFRTLFITSAASGIDLANEPFAGAVFSIDLPVGGSAAHRYKAPAMPVDLAKC